MGQTNNEETRLKDIKTVATFRILTGKLLKNMHNREKIVKECKNEYKRIILDIIYYSIRFKLMFFSGLCKFVTTAPLRSGHDVYVISITTASGIVLFLVASLIVFSVRKKNVLSVKLKSLKETSEPQNFIDIRQDPRNKSFVYFRVV